MPLTADEEALEFSLKVEQMRADIDLKTAQTNKVKQDWRYDPVRLAVSMFLAGGALVGGIVGLLTYLHNVGVI